MANLTIAVDDELLRAAKACALAPGTTVNALLCEYLETHAGMRARQVAAAEDALKLAEDTDSGFGITRWTREEIHERY